MTAWCTIRSADNRAAAMEYFQRAVDITPRMAHRLIKVLRRLRVECIVAPYEADAQLAYLSLKGYVQAVIRCGYAEVCPACTTFYK